MLISCPKCQAVYKLSNQQIPEEGKRFKCVECGRIWTVYAKDVQDLEPDNSVIKSQIVLPATSFDNNQSDMQEIFNRLSRDTKNLFDDRDTDNKNKFWILIRKIQVIFSPLFINCVIGLFIICATIFIGYYNRYEIVGRIPRLEDFYNKFHIESMYKGRDIVFKNVQTHNIEKNGQHFVEISGELYNQGNLTSRIIPIKAVMKNMHGEIEDETVKVLTLDRLSPKFTALFRIMFPNKTTNGKVVTLSFDPTINTKQSVINDNESKIDNKASKPMFNFGLNKGMDKF